MTDDTTDVAPATAAAAKKKGAQKKGKSNLVPAIIVAVGLFGAAFMMKGGASKKAAAATTSGATTASTTVPSDPKTLAQIAKLDDITLNLSDGHYLKVGLALQLAKKAAVTDYTTGGAAAKALDLTIHTLGADSYAQLAQPAVRDAAEAQLQKQVVSAYGGQVLAIYFTDFVMQ